MDSTQTLHDFVLNLLTDPQTRSAFQLDPETALNDAGLGDITAADVEEIVPLVVDYASVPGGTGLATADLDLTAAGTDPTDVIGQLQAVTEQLTGGAQPTSFDGNLAAAGAIAVNSSGLGVDIGGWAGFGVSAGSSGASAGLSGGQDVSGTLDSEVVDAVTAEPAAVVDEALQTTDGLLGEPADGLPPLGPVDDALGTVDDALGTVDDALDAADGALDTVDGILGDAGAAVDDLIPGDPTGVVDSGLDDAPLPDLGGTDGSVTGSVDGAVDGLLGGSAGGLLEAGAAGDAHGGASGSAGSGLPGTDILF